MSRPKKDLLGLRFGRLVAIKAWGYNKRHKITWLCKCDCGNEHVAATESLRRGSTKSCGCFRREEISRQKRTHGLSMHPLYMTWYEMMGKCYRPDHPRYGNHGLLGIKVCERWKDFDAFVQDMPAEEKKRNQVLVRVDREQDFTPENCIWGSRANLFRRNHKKRIK